MPRKSALPWMILVVIATLTMTWTVCNTSANAQGRPYPGPVIGPETFTCWVKGAPYSCSAAQFADYTRAQLDSTLHLQPTTYGLLTMAYLRPTIGDRAVITDASVCDRLSPVSGGGMNIPVCPVIWDGKAWVAD